MIWLQACITTPFLKKGQYLLISQRSTGNKLVPSEDIRLLYRQKANRKILGFTPYLAFYFFGKSIWDTSRIRKTIRMKEAKYDKKIAALPPGSFKDSLALEAKKESKVRNDYLNLYEGNWWMRVVGEQPAIYDSSLARESRNEIRKMLFNRGFFHNEVVVEEDTFIGGNVAVRYRIKENHQHRFRRVRYACDDYRLKRLIDSARSSMQVKTGLAYSKEAIASDREFLEKYFRDRGYYTFSRAYISAEVDTMPSVPADHEDSLLFQQKPELFLGKGVDVRFTVSNPELGRHKSYVIDRVNFQLNESDSSFGVYTDSLYNGVRYQFEKRKRYTLGILDSKVLLHPGQYYNYSKILNTQSQLSTMDMFRLVNLAVDTQGNNMRLKVLATRLPKYQSSEELGMLLSQGGPGPYINLGFKIRNIFGGFEVFETNLRYSQEGQLSALVSEKPDSVYQVLDLSISSSFTISKILFPFRLNPKIYEYNPKTRFIFSLTGLSRPEYARNLVKGSLTYTLQLSPTRQIGISPIDVSVNFTPRSNAAYISQLENFSGLGQSVRQTFQSSVVTSINSFYTYSSNMGNRRKTAYYFRLNLDYGGELMHRLFKKILNKDSIRVLNYSFQIFRYARTNADFRIYRPVNKGTMVAFRLSGGVAVPIGSSRVLPWEKYAFAGGSNSVRAWLPRRLGTGSYAPPGSDPNNLRTEQPGEIILESSIEIRQKLIGFLEGALFADAGNVWNLRYDPDRKGAEINPLFLRDLAIGGGIGLRFDFSFLIVRIDAATKIYNPAFSRNEDKWQVRNLRFNRPFGERGQTLLNVGIGYPF